MTNILTFDASSNAVTVAIKTNDCFHHYHSIEPRNHNKVLLFIINDLLEKASVGIRDLDVIGVGCGPGSFTGLRIASGIAQGLAFGANIPVISISSLAILAQSQKLGKELNKEPILVAVNAQMGEIYWGGYATDQDVVYPIVEEQLTKPSKVKAPAGNYLAVGDGWSYQEELENALREQAINVLAVKLDSYPNARDLMVLSEAAWQAGQAIPAIKLEPVYLRGESSWKKVE